MRTAPTKANHRHRFAFAAVSVNDNPDATAAIDSELTGRGAARTRRVNQAQVKAAYTYGRRSRPMGGDGGGDGGG
jgi:hypothetical protein